MKEVPTSVTTTYEECTDVGIPLDERPRLQRPEAYNNDEVQPHAEKGEWLSIHSNATHYVEDSIDDTGAGDVVAGEEVEAITGVGAVTGAAP